VAFYRATAALGAGRRAEAESLMVRAYSVNPLHIHVLNDLGSLEVAAGRFREGAAWYGKCLALRPDFTEARENLAAAWFDAGQFRKAKEILAAIPPQARTSRTEAYDRKVDERLKERSGYE
jgi:Flp pilus assembly protein TadD